MTGDGWVPVLWMGDVAGCMDQHLLAQLIGDEHYAHRALEPGERPVGAGAVVIVPGRFHSADEVSEVVAGLGWVVLVVTSDEESLFEVDAVDHPYMVTWVMTPRVGQHPPGHRYLGEGFEWRTVQLVDELDQGGPRQVDVVFAGQVTHSHRDAMAEALTALAGGRPDLEVVFAPTAGFTQGMPQREYLRLLTRARVALCPSGPQTPDSFRLYEALEAGCVPIVEAGCPARPDPGFWPLLYPHGVPFPVVDEWTLPQLTAAVDDVLGSWMERSTRCRAWWLRVKRQLAADLDHLVAGLGGSGPVWPKITVLVPTSPTTRSPQQAAADTAATIDSVLERLPGVEVLVMADGVRAEQEHLRGDYEAYLHWLVSCCGRGAWARVLPLVFDHHAHQANTTRAALELVSTPLVLFVEHDMPLVGEVPFDALAATVLGGGLNLVRLGQDREAEHYADLMLDEAPVQIGPVGLPVLRTWQWSQRPHLASTGFYRDLLGRYFGTRSRTMIEDVMHGVVAHAWHTEGEAGWEQFRLGLYQPPGDPTRSRHLDGRGDEPKFDMVYAYDGEVPEGAPASTEVID